MKYKYVVGLISGYKAAIVFPEYVVHADAARCLDPRHITSAGFFYYNDDEVIPYGESVSLRLKSNPDDAKLIGEAIGHPEYMS